MLFILLSLPFLTLGQYSLSNIGIGDRFVVPINTCFNNVTKSVPGGNWYNSGSTMCRCSQGDGPTDSSVGCFYYEDGDCQGDLMAQEIWGGCDDTGDIYGTAALYTIDGCKAAMEFIEDEANPECAYAINHGGSSSWFNDLVIPLGSCIDYNCVDKFNANSLTRSCEFSCDSGNIERKHYSDYTCGTYEGQAIMSNVDQKNKVCGITPTCGVTVTRYTASIGTFECGSKKSPFKTSSSSKLSNYILLQNNDVPIPIGQCAETRRGYYSWSKKYVCNEMDDGSYNVTLHHYLGNGNCKLNDAEDNMYVIETYVEENSTFVCGKSNSKGKVGFYSSCTSDPNWKGYYTDELTMFGTCLNFRTDPLTFAPDDSIYSDQPWYQNLRYVVSCNYNKQYPSVYIYVTDDCSGDYLFKWDAYSYYSQQRYSGQDCAFPQIKNCGNSKDSVGGNDVPFKYKKCQSTFV